MVRAGGGRGGDGPPADGGGGGFLVSDLRPSSPYLRWLLDELDGVGARPSADGDGARAGEDPPGGPAEGGRALRRRLDGAVDALRRTGAAYAATVEMPRVDEDADDADTLTGEGRRRMRRARDALDLQNGMVRENDERRHLSRHERRLREGSAGGGTDGTSLPKNATVPVHELVGTSWRATGMAYGAESMRAPLPDSPITLAFGPASGPDGSTDPASAYVSGSDGCNRYHGSASLRGRFVDISGVATTRMLCRGDEAAQERNFTGLISGSTFVYETDGRGLSLMGTARRRKGRAVPGPAVAVFEAEPGGGGGGTGAGRALAGAGPARPGKFVTAGAGRR